ncbi:hypothetical protein BSKO_12738 [Bryopsis sp. KO-2023]|nr:hypothetical protein BSKO_12738 [Bryopsis sp. KO-2023]
MKGKKGGKKKGKKKSSKSKGPPPEPFIYDLLTIDQLKQSQDEFVRCRLCNTEVTLLNFEIPSLCTNSTLASIKHAIQTRHAGAVYDVILFKDSPRPEYMIYDTDHSTLRDIGVRGATGGNCEDYPTLTLFYDFPPQHSDDPLLTMMTGGDLMKRAVAAGSTHPPTHHPNARREKKKSQLGVEVG